ncbi:hypothetical protein [Streptomyces sp. NPDC055085]
MTDEEAAVIWLERNYDTTYEGYDYNSDGNLKEGLDYFRYQRWSGRTSEGIWVQPMIRYERRRRRLSMPTSLQWTPGDREPAGLAARA